MHAIHTALGGTPRTTQGIPNLLDVDESFTPRALESSSTPNFAAFLDQQSEAAGGDRQPPAASSWRERAASSLQVRTHSVPNLLQASAAGGCGGSAGNEVGARQHTGDSGDHASVLPAPSLAGLDCNTRTPSPR